MKKIIKTILACLAILFGFSVVLEAFSPIPEGTGAAEAGSTVGSIFLFAVGAMLILISVTFLYRTYIKKSAEAQND